MQKFLIFLCLFLFGCSTVAGGTAVFIASKYSQYSEKKNRTYKGINECFTKGQPEAFSLAESIVYGSPIANDYEFILNPERDKKDPRLPHHLAYAFYLVAEKIGDSRANYKKQWMLQRMPPQEAKEIEEFIDKKYLHSFLTKCFSVPHQFKLKTNTRDEIIQNNE